MNQKGYLCLDRSFGKVIVRRHVFSMSIFPFVKLSSIAPVRVESAAIISVSTNLLVACPYLLSLHLLCLAILLYLVVLALMFPMLVQPLAPLPTLLLLFKLSGDV